MSRYSYAGDFKNPTEGWQVIPNPNGDGYVIGVPIDPKEIIAMTAAGDPDAQALAEMYQKNDGYRPHTNGQVFADPEDAHASVESIEEFFEEDYDAYLEENSHAIAQMERYEMWRNEH